jgi:predicted transcriptional regulator
MSLSTQRPTAHQLLAQAIPGWPQSLAAATQSPQHRLIERLLAQVLDAEARQADRIDHKRRAAGDME